MSSFIKLIKIILFITLFFTGIMMNRVEAQAETIPASPLIFDFKAVPREVVKGSIILKTIANYKMNIYTFTNNFDPILGIQEFKQRADIDISTSLANWIRIDRWAKEVMPGRQETKMDFEIDVNPTAKPGMYHAIISFADGPARDDAALNLNNLSKVLINLEILEEIDEKLQLNKFFTDEIFSWKGPTPFSYVIENVGNRSLAPLGEIRIFNRRGVEIDTINVNADKKSLESGTSSTFRSSWNNDKKFGKFKALLHLDYGERQRGTLQDTIFFWILPRWFVIILSLVLILFIVLFYIIYKER